MTPVDSVFRAGPVDVDADGIDDAIDTGTGTFRDGGTTAGTIGPVPAGYTVTVTDLPDPDGVRVTVSGSGLLEVTITLSNPVSGVPCGAVALLPGSNVDVVCGSITARVADESPPVRIVLSDDTSLLVGAGEQTTVSLANDGSFVVTKHPGEFTKDELSGFRTKAEVDIDKIEKITIPYVRKTGNLDEESARTVIELLEELHRSRECTLLIVTHNTSVARRAPTHLRMVAGTLETR